MLTCGLFAGLFVRTVLLGKKREEETWRRPRGHTHGHPHHIYSTYSNAFLPGENKWFWQVFFHLLINNSYGPLISALPLTLADKVQDTTEQPVTVHDTPQQPTPVHDTISATPAVASSSKDGPAPHYDDMKVEESAAGPTQAVEYGFAHPAASRPQRSVWLPLDTLGLAKEEEKHNREAGVLCAAMNAVMNESGKVDVTGPPPDEVEDEE